MPQMTCSALGAGPACRRRLKQASTWLFFLLFSAAGLLYQCRGWTGEYSALPRRPMAASSEISLANDLENAVLERFDTLVASGSIFYEASDPEVVQHKGFQV